MTDENLMTKWLVNNDPYLARLIILQVLHIRCAEQESEPEFKRRLDEYLALAEERFEADM